MTIVNPQKECPAVPEKLSGESKITSVFNDDRRQGIILDNPRQVIEALKVYCGGEVGESFAAHKDMMTQLGGRGEGRAAALIVMAEHQTNRGSQFFDELLAEVSSKGSVYRNFDYHPPVHGLFKTILRCAKVDDKYVLDVSASQIHQKAGNALARTIGRPLALTSATSTLSLSIVDDWWFNVNIKSVLENLPVQKYELNALPETLVKYSSRKMQFTHERQPFTLDVMLNCYRYAKPDGKKHDSLYLRSGESNIVGAAWADHLPDSLQPCAPRPVAPSLVLSVYIADPRLSHPAVTDEKMQLLRRARDYIAQAVKTD